MFPFPKELSGKRDGSMAEWIRKWSASPEGREYRRTYFQFSQARLQPDGTIRVDDVPPGAYRLTLTYSAEEPRGIFFSPERTAYATQQFVVPPLPEGRSDEPFDLGVLRPEPRQPVKKP